MNRVITIFTELSFWCFNISSFASHPFLFSYVGTEIKPIPPENKIDEWRADYAKMKQYMIYDEDKPSFEELIQNLNELKTKLQNINWQFELTFPINKTAMRYDR